MALGDHYRRFLRGSLLARLLWMSLSLSFWSSAEQVGEVAAFRNPDTSAEQRAADLVSRMTLEEKVLQMQNSAPAILRLGIPAYDWWNEGLHGVARAGLATVFPQAIGLAATWDTPLMGRVAETISTEARAKYNQAQRQGDHSRYHGLTYWSPNINIFRDPRWGRGQETYGEDPFLTSRMAVAFIRGMQGNDSRYLKTIATPKHFAIHSGPEPSRHSFDVHPGVRDMEETYLPAFKASLVEGRAASVMCAYNRLDGTPACANSLLLNKYLRSGWGFQGYVVSDCGAIDDFVHGHNYKPTMPEAAALAVKAGTDLTCGDEYASLVEAVKRGLITEHEIDRSLKRLFVARIRLGMFDPVDSVSYSTIPASEIASAEHRKRALEAARASIVLLRNDDHFLPLKKRIRRIAVLGPAADDPDTMLANYHGIPSSMVTPLEGLRRQFGADSEIRFAQGSMFTRDSSALVPPEIVTPPASAASVSGKFSQKGLLAEYFANADLQGRPELVRVEPRVDLQREMQEAALEAKIPRTDFSVRWSGILRAPYSGKFTIGVVRMRCEDCEVSDSALVYLDNKRILSEDAQSPATPETAIELERGKAYRLRVEYRQHAGGVGVRLVWKPPPEPLLKEAVREVKNSDVAVAFVGLNSQLEGEEMKIDLPGFSGGDRTSLDLPETQQRLLDAVLKTGKPLVVVLLSGSSIVAKDVANLAGVHANAILEAWYGGEEGGTAIAQTLAGDNNPAGRIPVTFYRSVNQLPAFEDYAMRGRTYRYFDGKPLYPFGFGLSYSTFRFSDLQVEPEPGEKVAIRVSARVENTSKTEGDEVAQLYVGREPRGDDDPIRELRGFQRIHLNAGESRVLQFDVDLSSAVTRNADAIRSPGKFRVSVGGGQPGTGAPCVDALF